LKSEPQNIEHRMMNAEGENRSRWTPWFDIRCVYRLRLLACGRWLHRVLSRRSSEPSKSA